jgi:CheY-like chemotaxis protein
MPTPHRVVFLGFSDLERKSLAAAFRLAVRRKPAYGLARMLSDSECDFVVADADHPPSVQLVLAEDRLATTVFVGAQAPAGARAWLPRPVDALHVMRELDGCVAALDTTPPEAVAPPPAPPVAGKRPRGPVRSHIDGEPVARFSDSQWPEAVLHPPPADPAGPAHPASHRGQDPAEASAPASDAIPSAATTVGLYGHAAAGPAARPPQALPQALPPAVPTLVRAAEAAVSAPMPLPPTLDLELPLNGAAPGSATPPRAPNRPRPPASGLLLQPSRRVAAPPAPPPNALIVDDSEIAREFLGQRLHRWGLHCDLVADSTQALAQLERSDYAFVFLDVDLGPQSALDGLMLCQHIKRHPRVAGVAPPVVAMVSAHAGHIDRARGTLAGCDAYLGKPLDDEALLRLLRGNGLPPPRPQTASAHS